MTNIKDVKYDLGLDMTVEDQKKIGKFTNLHYKQSVYEQKMKLMKENISNIDSSIDEVSLVFDPQDVMLNIGIRPFILLFPFSVFFSCHPCVYAYSGVFTFLLQ